LATNHCSAGQLVPISASQGIWELPPKDFPNHYGSGGGGRLLRGGGSIARRLRLASIGGISSCSAPTDAATSGSVATSIAGASKVASGTIDGQSRTLWSKNGETGSAALEDAGVILDGHAYGLCPGSCKPGKLVTITGSMGQWSASG
jgi:hypothetical protein